MGQSRNYKGEEEHTLVRRWVRNRTERTTPGLCCTEVRKSKGWKKEKSRHGGDGHQCREGRSGPEEGNKLMKLVKEEKKETKSRMKV
ncbi:hypothetical protein Pmani_011077 [Petrolisthes manimaculis]|uniref:Uncharacterized protein n=1 Tax=Petrolisthes manimaculis TaxID=1843537 RepID=A0AAE1UBD7_9EUCA|nr:hypothetical protein Pmani_011077 [Petrolisthes manimaculis]